MIRLVPPAPLVPLAWSALSSIKASAPQEDQEVCIKDSQALERGDQEMYPIRIY